MNFIIFTRDSIKQKWRGGQSGTYQRLTIGVVGSTGERREDVEMKRKSEKDCWSLSIIHKLPDSAPDHIRHQFEIAYQLVLQSRHTPGLNIH